MNKALPVKKTTQLHTVVIGSGPVGIRFVEELIARDPFCRITLFGEEQVTPYDRVQLSSLLAGQTTIADIEYQLPQQSPWFSFEPFRVTEINTQLKRISSADGRVHNFDHLVLATGARAHVPDIPGLDQRGVFTFRNLKDTESLYARTSRTQHLVVVGGGVLGIEAAHALLKNNTRVTLVQQGPHLMNKQLDDPAATLLQQHLEDRGVRVITNSGVRKITGDGRVSGVMLRNQAWIDCDTVLFCSGISPNIELARAAGIRVNRGVVVDDHLCSSNPSVFAIGECCEHRDQTYGFVKPGYEQAAVLAEVVSAFHNQAKPVTVYSGSQQSTVLKVVDKPVHSFGSVVNYRRTPFHRETVHAGKDYYRKLVTLRGQLVGGVSVGVWDESLRTLECFAHGRRVSIVRRWLFKLTGSLWLFGGADDVNTWPESSVICQCRTITKSAINTSIRQGSESVAEIRNGTGASSVCGSCQPMLEVLLAGHKEKPAERQKEWAWRTILSGCVLAALVAVLIPSVPGVKTGASVTAPAMLEFIWNDKWWKQVTGFTLVGLSAIGLLMAVRKRLTRFGFGRYAAWRVLHIFLGLASVMILLLHTGMHSGENLNHWLLLNFLLVISFGALAGTVVALSHRFTPVRAQRIRKRFAWLHTLITWPLPVLIGLHILTVYYF